MRIFRSKRTLGLSSIQLALVATLVLGACVTARHGDIASSSRQLAADEPSSEIPDKREFPVNPAIKPCDNFYEYACSVAISKFKLRPDRTRHVFAFHDSNERLLTKRMAFFQSLSDPQELAKIKPRTKDAYTYYQACMNEKAGAKEEKGIVATNLAEMSKLSTREALLADLSARIAGGDYSFIDLGNIANQDAPDQYDYVMLTHGRFLPERAYVKDEALMAELKKVLVDFFGTLKLDQAEQRAEWVLDFERKMQNSYPLPEEMRELWSKRTQITKAQLLERYPHIGFKKVLDRVPAKTLIRDITPANFKELDDYLANAPVDAIKSVFLFRELVSKMDDGYPAFFKELFAFNNKFLGGPPERSPRQERCTKATLESFNKELDAELIDRIFPNFPRQKVVELAEKIRSSILAGIERNTWLSPESKKGALEKIRVAYLQLVSPRTEEEWYFNPKNTYSATRPYENAKKLARSIDARSFAELKLKRKITRWDMSPLTVNAYYSAEDNKFVLPQGILQPPFFDTTLPLEANLGSMGMVIGHELGHGIDDQGAHYDSKGRLHQWMTDADIVTFKKRGEALVEQFNAVKHNGKNTLGENTADLVGLTFAYQAAFPDGKGTVEAKREFFTQYSHNWCGVTLPKQEELLLRKDPHALGWARVNEQVKHQDGFQEAFACKDGDALYLAPEKRIKIW